MKFAIGLSVTKGMPVSIGLQLKKRFEKNNLICKRVSINLDQIAE